MTWAAATDGVAMGKLFGILVIVVAIWVGLTVYNEGPAAFGGIFAGADLEADEEYIPAHERAADRWADAHDTGANRVDRALSRKGASE